MPQIHIIAPTKQQQPDRLRVCAYARVSSDSTDQLNSYASQIRYYTSYITAHENWDFVDIYADEGITGTRADKRDDFQRMLRDCRAHRIDLILVKSLSRFARNTEDCIAAVRELRQLGVTVIFEKEHLNTGTMANEMLLSMMSAFAQEESVSISKNMHKGAVMRMQNGTYISSRPAFGYRNGENGMIIVPEETEIVKYIYEQFLAGEGIARIQKSLLKKFQDGTTQKIFSPNGILYILTNERYIGDERLQKTYSNGQVPFNRSINKGFLPQFYSEASHPPIIDRDKFHAVQDLLEIKKLRFSQTQPGHAYPLTNLLRCSYCGQTLHRRTHNKGIEWTCRTHLKESSACPLKPVPYSAFKQIFTRLYFKLKSNNSFILLKYLSNVESIIDVSYYSQPEVASLNKKLSDLLEQNHTLNRLHNKGCLDSAFFISQKQTLQQQIADTRKKLKKHRCITNFTLIADSTQSLLDAIESSPPTDFIEFWIPHISTIIVSTDCCEIRLINELTLSEYFSARQCQ